MLSEAFDAVSQIGKIGNNLTDADQKQLKLLLSDYKRKCEATDIAEKIFIGKIDTAFIGDNSFEGTDQLMLPKKNHRAYWLLREKFNKMD